MELLVVAIFLILVAISAYSYASKKWRRDELADLALDRGLNFSSGDPLGLLNCDLPLFAQGDDRGIENTMWGEWQGLELAVADYWYATESTDAKGHGTRSYDRFSLVSMEVPAFLPNISIAPESIVTWMADRVGFRDIDFESGEFNDRFQVKAESRKFAYEIVDARMMRWLLSIDRRFSFQMRGTRVVIFSRRLPPSDVFLLMGTMKELRDRIPDLVWETYGTGRPDKTGAAG